MSTGKSQDGSHPRYLLLMRHGEHRDGVLTVAGHRDVAEVAKALSERLADPPDGDGALTIACVYHARSREAKATAEKVAAAFVEREPPPLEPLAGLESTSSDARSRERARTAVRRVWDDVLPKASASDARSAVLLVGHLPLLAWVAAELTGTALPMGRGELLAIRLHGRTLRRPWRTLGGEFRWAITAGSRGEKVIELVQTKIKSKMEAAKYLASFVTATLGIQLALMADPAKIAVMRRPLSSAQGADSARVAREAAAALAGADRFAASGLAAAALLLVLAAALYFVTIFAYDKLLMPVELWADGRPSRLGRRGVVERPPSSAAWVLLLGMQRVWRWIFTPATVLLIASLLLQAAVLFVPTLDRSWRYAVLGIAAAFVVLVAAGTWWVGWPRLGSED